MKGNFLHITNGGSAAEIMQQAEFSGEILPWQDVLHEGPVPAGKTLQEMSEIRAKFIADEKWDTLSEVQTWFRYRDSLIERFHEYDGLILWFEHDLYDQLQLIQILSYLATQDIKDANIMLCCIDRYLGMLSVEDMKAITAEAKPLGYEQIVIATTAWQIFTLNDPNALLQMLEQDTKCLPFLDGAFRRLIEEYPNAKTGLTRTQFEILKIISENALPPGKLFGEYIKTEERRFMGDTVFWKYIALMLEGDSPLLTLPEGIVLTLPSSPDQILTITELGKQVLNGEKTWSVRDRLNRWIGGVHLTPDNYWGWDDEAGVFVREE